MKRTLLLIAALALLPFAAGHAGYAIVNNSTSGQTAHDSLSIPFFLLDSAGNQVAIASGDSVFLVVWYPGGDVSAQDSGAFNDADITTQTRHGMSWYSWQAQVSELDGTPTEGTYSYTFSVHDKTSADLWTPFTGSFQLYATVDLDVILDYLDAAISSRGTSDLVVSDNIGVNLDDVSGTLDASEIGADAITAAKIADAAIAAEHIADDAFDYATFAATAPTAWWNEGKTGYTVSTVGDKTGYSLSASQTFDMTGDITGNLSGSVGSVTGSVGSVTAQVTADVTAISGDAGAADSLKEACDGYDDAGLTLFERIVAMLDSLDNHDNWVAQQAMLSALSKYNGACDDCYQILWPRDGSANKDSVQIIDPTLGTDSITATIIFNHNNVPAVYDSSYFYLRP